MPYVVFDDITSLIPAGWLVESLDDDNDGNEESFEAVRAAAEDAVNGVLSTSYNTPIANAASFPFLKHVTRLEVARICYARRGYDATGFPHKDSYKSAWDQLTRIGKGDLPLGPGGNTGTPKANPRGSIITGPARTHSSSGSFTA